MKAGAQHTNDLLFGKSSPQSLLQTTGSTNWFFFKELLHTYQRIYLLLAAVASFLLIFIVTFLIKKTLVQSANSFEAYLAWVITVVGICLSMFGKRYDSILRGMDFISLINRWETLLNLLLGIIHIAILLLRPSITYLVLATHLITVLTIAKKRHLMYQYIPQLKRTKKEKINFNKGIFLASWEPTWKTGVIISSTQGVSQLSGMILSNVIPPAALASYLFSQKLLHACNQFSWAPFYSKIPQFNQLRMKGKISELRQYTFSSLNKSLYILVTLTFLVGITISKVLLLIKANTEFVTPSVWILLLLGTFVDRIQAMHGQIFMTTNNIKLYITSFFSGAIYLALLLLTIRTFEIYAIPIALITSNLVLNFWYNQKNSLQSLDTNFKEYFLSFLYKPIFLMILGSFFLLGISYLW